MLYSQKKRNGPLRHFTDWLPYLKPFIDAFPHKFPVRDEHIYKAVCESRKYDELKCPIAIAYEDKRIVVPDEFSMTTTVFNTSPYKLRKGVESFGLRIDIVKKDEQMSRAFLFRFVGQRLFDWYSAFEEALAMSYLLPSAFPPSIHIILDNHNIELECHMAEDTD